MDNDNNDYTVFKRSITSWPDYITARKYKIESNLTYAQAQRLCRGFNAARTPSQIRRGTKYEFTSNY